MDNRGGGGRRKGVSRFSVENCLSHSAGNSVGEPFSVSLVSGIEKIYASEGYVTIFRRKSFVSQYRNISWGEPFCDVFQKISVSQKIYG